MGDNRPEGVIWRTVFTVAAGLGWLIWLLLWWAFWAGDYTVAQRFAVAIMSLMMIGGVAGAIWIPFSMRHGDDRDDWKREGFVGRVMASMAVFVGLSIFVVYMLFFPWKDFNWCQSIVIIIVVLLAGAIMMTPMWMRWGRRGHHEMDLDDFAEDLSEVIEDAVEDAFERSKKKKNDDDDDD
jgi:hypothetical protein